MSADHLHARLTPADISRLVQVPACTNPRHPRTTTTRTGWTVTWTACPRCATRAKESR